VVCSGGDPGIGKSTSCMQTLATLKEVLYVHRRGIRGADRDARAPAIARRRRRAAARRDAARAHPRALDAGKPAVAVIDSIQTLWSETPAVAPGSVAQVRECARS